MKSRLEFIVWCLMDEINDPHLKRAFTNGEKTIIKDVGRLIHENRSFLSALVIRKIERIWRKDYYSNPRTDEEEDHIETE